MSSSKQKQIHPKDQAAHDPFAAMRFRDYRLFTIGRVLLFTGGQMQTVAIGWELYERTNSPLALGAVGLAQVIPMILLTLIAGHIADKYNRQRTTLLAIFILAVCSLALGAISYTKGAIFLVYTCLIFMGVARAFLKPASDALMWQLIPTNVFANAATWVSSSFQLASVIGPALGGFAIFANEIVLPVTISGRLNLGTKVPKGNIVEGVKGIKSNSFNFPITII